MQNKNPSFLSGMSHSFTRRRFLKQTGAVAAAAVVGRPLLAQGKFEMNSDTLKVGLIGCGGRGTGAARQALHADPNVVLWAVGDAFPEPPRRSLGVIKRDAKVAPRVKVTPERVFVGLDAFKKVLASGVHVVILTTPPGFRPEHFAAAVKAGKHVFTEKPMATDVYGVKWSQETVKEAKRKGLSVMPGFCWRREFGRREFYKRVHDGAIGKIRAIYATYLTGPVRPMPPADKRPAGMGDLEWQLRNWYNFVWLSGDGLVEQACHSIDKINWAMQNVPPAAAVATGGRQIPNNEGNIYDHIDVFFEWPDGTRAFMAQRQIRNCYSDNSDYLMGADGLGTIKGWSAPIITGKVNWRYRGPKNDMYQTEHDELFASIRKGEPINDGDWMLQSTMMGLMGRTAAYTGKRVTWEQMLNSKLRLVPEHYSWDMKLPIRPMAKPGITPFV